MITFEEIKKNVYIMVPTRNIRNPNMLYIHGVTNPYKRVPLRLEVSIITVIFHLDELADILYSGIFYIVYVYVFYIANL